MLPVLTSLVTTEDALHHASSLAQVIGLGPFIHDFNCLPEIGNHFSPEGPIPEAKSKQPSYLEHQRLGFWLVVPLVASKQQYWHYKKRILIMGTCSPGDYLILPRNSHKSAISSLVLSGAIPKYIIPEYSYDWDIPAGVMPSQVENAIKELEKEGKKAAVVFVPSPTYHGDQLPYSALQQGADLVVQSTHKVLCSLTQSSMLHLSTKTSVDRERISMCLQSLQTTSPNNLLLASLDAARAQLNENPKTVFNEAINLATETRYLLKNIPGISVLDSSSFPNFQTRDPLRLTLGFWQLGLSGYQANDILHKDLMVICELVGSRSLTFAFNLGTCREQIQRLVSAIQQVSPIHSSLSNGKFVNGLVADENSVMGPSADIEIGLNPREC
ncbi:hypothetical protein Q3G72_005485 [Acer saccharum]|nr:hypothetical protein Q3G72_005485 [Acer saccharum]